VALLSDSERLLGSGVAGQHFEDIQVQVNSMGICLCYDGLPSTSSKLCHTASDVRVMSHVTQIT